MKTISTVCALALILTACSNGADSTADDTEAAPAATEAAQEAPAAGASLADVIADARRDEKRARDEWRHPLETLTFFGIESDMTIIEVLPGNGG